MADIKKDKEMFKDLSLLFHLKQTNPIAFSLYNDLRERLDNSSNETLIISPTLTSSKSCFRYMAPDFIEGKVDQANLILDNGFRTIRFIPISKLYKIDECKFKNIYFQE